MGSVGWLRAAAPGLAPPPTNKLGLCQRVSVPGLGLTRGCGVWGKNTVELRDWEVVGVEGGSWVRAGAAQGSSLPAGRGRPRGSVWS